MNHTVVAVASALCGRFFYRCIGLGFALFLGACGGGVPTNQADAHEHEEEHIDTAGRLALTMHNAAVVRIHDLDTGTQEAEHALDYVPSALYASPSHRYALAVQRLQDQVQFVDGGIWQEDHGDHDHDFKQASRLLTWTLSGARPTHYDVQAGVQAAFFMDGNAAAIPPHHAAVRVLTDASIGAAQVSASMDLPLAVHGLSQPVDDTLLVVARAADAADTLPTHLQLHQREGSTYRFVRELPTRCNGMHGGFSSGTSTVVGCIGGMLSVRHLDADTVSDGVFIATPLRVGTVTGHARLPDQFIGIATEGVAPATVTTRFYAFDAINNSVSPYVPQGWEEGRVRRAHAFDRSGQRFFVLDDQGTLIVAQWQAGVWQPLARIPGAIASMPSAAPWPALAANGARDEIYLTDPVAQALVVINSVTGAPIARRALGFVPVHAAWLGIEP